ncbi:MAG: MAPEG family protein [Polyangiaceae bacterium]
MTFVDLPAFKPFVLFSVLLVFKMFFVGVITANRRRLSKVVANPEDVGVNPGSHAEAQEAPETLRAKRAHQNDLENVPGFLMLALIFTLMGGSATGGWAYFGTYFAARTLHSFFYLNQLQPWRTIAFGLGQLTLLGVAVQLLMRAFGHS